MEKASDVKVSNEMGSCPTFCTLEKAMFKEFSGLILLKKPNNSSQPS